MKRWRDALE